MKNFTEFAADLAEGIIDKTKKVFEEVELSEATVGSIAQEHGFKKQTSGVDKGSYVHPKTGETISSLRGETFGHSRKDGSTIASFKHKNSLEKHLADKGYEKTAVSEEVELDEANLDQLKKQLAQHKKEFDRFASVGGPPRSHPVHAKMQKVRKEIAAAKANSSHFGESAELDEAKMDKDHPIVKEYDSLKKNHDIKSLRGLIKGQHRIVDTSEYRTKDHAISSYLRTKHGNKKVDQAFGFKEETELDEAHKIGSKVEIVKGSAKGTKGHIGEIRHGLFKGAAKTYTVYHGEHGAVQVPKEHIRTIKESAVCSLCDSDPCICDDSHGFVTEGYTGRETKDGTWRVFKDGHAVAVAGPFKSAEQATAWIKNHKQGVAESAEDIEEGIGDTIKRGVKKLTAPVKDPILDQMKDITNAANKRAHDAQNKKYAPSQHNEGVSESIATFKQFIEEQAATWYSKEKFIADAEKKHGKITKTTRDKDGRTHYHIASGHSIGMSDTDGEGDTSYNVHAKPHMASK